MIAYAKKNGNRAGEHNYGVAENLIRDWHKQKDMLDRLPHTKCMHQSAQQKPMLA